MGKGPHRFFSNKVIKYDPRQAKHESCSPRGQATRRTENFSKRCSNLKISVSIVAWISDNYFKLFLLPQ